MRKLNSEKFRKSAERGNAPHAERGNAMVYILVAIALFGFLTMTLSRQNQQSDNQNLDDEQLELQSTTVMSYATATKSVIDQMRMTGTSIDQLDFVLPNAASYDLGSNIHKVYHPDGGGLSATAANPNIFTGIDNDPDPGWYAGVFNDVEWTDTTATDVILTAHQISEGVCEQINEKITGSTSIPAIGGTGLLADYLVDDADHSGTNTPFNATVCAACEGYPSLCVSNTTGDMWSYYNIIEGR